MEKIQIQNIEKKDSGLVIVKYNNMCTPLTEGKEATLNTKWQAQEVDYLEKDVGYGGSVSVCIVQKGNYTNITKVDMTSGEKVSGAAQMEVMMNQDAPTKQSEKFRSPKEIVACVLVECWARTMSADTPQEHILEAYNFFLKNL